jgi:PleD family two-component response regulator
LPVRVSVGIAQYRQGESASVLVRRADGALYHAKANGRDRVEVA